MRDASDWAPVHRRLAEFARAVEEAGSRSEADVHERLVERTRAAAHRADETSGTSWEVLEFSVGGERYAVESRHLSEVVALAQCIPLPNLPAHVQGIVHLHGRIVSVLDLRILFGMPIGDLPERNYLVVLGSDVMEFGIVAHGIQGIGRIALAKLSKDLPNLDDLRARYLVGITPEQRVLLDGARLLDDDGLVVEHKK